MTSESPEIIFDATIVFQKIWNAIHEVTDTGDRRWRYIILEGSSRSSKTRSLLQAYYQYAYGNLRKRMSVWRDVAKDCRDTVGYDMGTVYPDMAGYNAVSFHSTKSVYTFPTKSTIEITGTDDVNKVHGYQGDVIWLNEPYDIGRETFNQLDMRTADVVLIDWNPKQQHFIDDLKKDSRTLVIHSTFRDNPFCPPKQRLKILSYQPVSRAAVVVEGALTELEARQYDCLTNRAGFTEKQRKELQRCQDNEAKNTANEFNWDVYGLGIKAEKPNRIFRWREVPDAVYFALDAKRYTGCDWGTVDAWGILEAKYYDGALYLHERNYKSENKIREELTDRERAVVAGQETEQEHMHSTGIVTFTFDRLGIDKRDEIICDFNRPRKIAALRRAGWTYAMPAVKGSDSIIDGIEMLQNIRVFYTQSSTNLVYEQENYSYAVDRYGVVTDEPEDKNNHLIDPTRYIGQYLQSKGIINRV